MDPTENIDAKAQAELLVVLAGAGVAYGDLTQFERFIWMSGYKLGHGQGMRDGVAQAREIVEGAVK